MPGDIYRRCAVKDADWRVHPVAQLQPGSIGLSIHGVPSHSSAAMSASTMIRASSAVCTEAFHPSDWAALVASPISESTSVGRR